MILSRLLHKHTSTIILICVLVVALYLIIDTGQSGDIVAKYDAVKSDSNSSFSRSLKFLETYTKTTGNVTLAESLGLSKEDIESIMLGGSTGYMGDGGVKELGDKYLDIASAICNNFRTPGTSEFSYSMSRASDPKPNGWTGPVTYKGRTTEGTHRDCSCFVSNFLYLAGLDPSYVHRTSYNFYAGSWGTEISVSTFNDMLPGDVICMDGHVAIVVAKDDEYIYFGDAGSTSLIKSTYENGYGQKFKLTDSVSIWRDAKEKVYRLVVE